MSHVRKTLIANWKMNPTVVDEAKALFRGVLELAPQYPTVDIVVCPPFVYMEDLSDMLAGVSNVFLGAQDFHWAEKGAFTGEISLPMLQQFGVSHVLVGHSERRVTESDEMINQKVQAALQHGFKTVLLVGEKERGDHKEDILIDQLSRDLKAVPVEHLSNLILAYEPVWAISSHSGGLSDTPESAEESITMIQKILSKLFGGDIVEKIPMLYGGSVNPINIEGFMSQPNINGVVVGAASLDIKKFEHLVEVATQYSHD